MIDLNLIRAFVTIYETGSVSVAAVSQLTEVDGKFVLAGATKEALKAMPSFEYKR